MKNPINVLDLTWAEKVAAEVLKMGVLPQHVAIILDGNRRFSRKARLESVMEGHVAGVKNFKRAVNLLLYLGVKELTAYIFSIENFKRSAKEVAGMMDILRKELGEINEAHEQGICFNFIGNLELTPTSKLRESIENAMLKTKNNKRLKINFAFVYTGRNEITKGVNQLLKGILEEKLGIDQVNEKLLQDIFFTLRSSLVDILIRSSGETRLSDFMTWSGSEAYLEFVDKMWPEFETWDLLKIIFKYQRRMKVLS